MKSRILPLSPRAQTNMRSMRRAEMTRSPFCGALCGVLILAAVICAALAMPSAAALRSIRNSSGSTSTAADKSDIRVPAAGANERRSSASLPILGAGGMLTTLVPQAPPGPEAIATFASDCITPQTVFNLGDVVCAKYTDAPTYPFFPLRRITWFNTGGLILQQTDVMSSTNTVLFTIPTTAVSTEGLDRRGSWGVNSISTSDGSVHATASFTVRDPNNAAANLSVFQLAEGGNATIPAGANLNYTVYVINRGPDVAQNVQLTEPPPTTSTNAPAPAFVSRSQLSGPSFTCSSNSNCSIATLPVGSVAVFDFTYNVDSGTPNYTIISDNATFTSDTTDPRTSDNSSVSDITVLGVTNGQDCVLECPNDMTVTANATDNGQSGAFVTFGAAEPFGPCGTISTNHTSGSFFPIGSTIVSSTSSTGGGSCSFTITVVAPSGPTISCPADVVTTITSGCTTTVDPGTPTTSGTGVTLTALRSDSDEIGEPFAVGTTTIIWTATDSQGQSNTCRQLVTVNASGAALPTISAPADVSVNTGPGSDACAVTVGEEIIGDAQATGCSAAISRIGVPQDNLFPVGVTTLTWKVTDAAGNTATDTQTVTVIDNTPPVVNAPAGTSASASSSCAAAIPNVINASTIFDNCTPGTSLTITQSPAAGTSVGLGSHTITITATDLKGNIGTGTTTFEVVDDTSPTITAPPDVQSSTDATSCSASNVNLGTPQTSDNCTVASVTNNAPATFPRGTTIVTWTVTDGAGHTATATQNVTVNDTTSPVITIAGANPMTVECHTSFTDPGASASDSCDGARAVSASNDVNINSPGSYSVTYTATDTAGNPATATRTVNVVDTTRPTITLSGASPMTVECHTSFTDPGASASDSCDTNVPVSVSGSVNVNVPGAYTLSYAASDDSGNAAIAVTRTVNVVDTTPPTITLNGQTPSMWPANHKYKTFLVTDFVTGVTDSCNTSLGIGSVTIAQVTSDETENGNGDGNTMNDIVIAADCKTVQLRAERDGSGNGRVYTITFRVRDASGNTTTATARIVVPHNPGETAVDSGAHYTVTGGCP